jgi:hypothetical protein
VREKARAREAQARAYVAALGADADFLAARLLTRPVTLNFHPDRYCADGRQVLEGLAADGAYRGQFETGTTNGGRTAYPGGDRFLWERRLFSDAYPPDARRRPKYGALNALYYLDGASARFGSCFLTRKPSVLSRVTFAYGDSSSDPEILCTADSFVGIVAALLRDAIQNGRFLNRENLSPGEALRLIADPPAPEIGRNLDHCIEAHVHGEVLLREDAAALNLDASFRGTETAQPAASLSDAFGVPLFWIPERRLPVDEIGDDFRGPAMRPLAARVDALAGGGGYVNAARIGAASRNSVDFPERWRDLGDEPALFQFFKQLWHTTAFYGRCL